MVHTSTVNFLSPLRVQIVKLLVSGLGNYGNRYSPQDADVRWDSIHDTLAHEYGLFELAEGDNNQERCLGFFLKNRTAVEMCLDLESVRSR